MAELRTDWLTGRSVIVAEHRALRPNEFATSETLCATPASPTQSALPCPFCPGQESGTPTAVYTRYDEHGHWQVRVVPNKFPVVTVDESAAMGAHEVIVESARHVDHMSALSVSEFRDVLVAYQDRLAHWHDQGRFQYGLIFKNLGAVAGASLAHVHSQLVAFPDQPPTVAAEFGRAEQFCIEQRACAYCRRIEEVRANRELVVFDERGLIAFCPHVSLQPGEVWLMPTEHEAWFERRTPQNPCGELAEGLHTLLVRIEAILPRPAYNLLVRTAPWRESAAVSGHWRIEILPRINPLAGFEFATHIHINPITPTRAAEQLRSR